MNDIDSPKLGGRPTASKLWGQIVSTAPPPSTALSLSLKLVVVEGSLKYLESNYSQGRSTFEIPKKLPVVKADHGSIAGAAVMFMQSFSRLGIGAASRRERCSS